MGGGVGWCLPHRGSTLGGLLWGVSAPRGCLLWGGSAPSGHLLAGGVCCWEGEGVCCQGVSALGGGLLPGGHLLPGGVCCWGEVSSARGVSAPGGLGTPSCTEADTPPPVNRITDACKNITPVKNSMRMKINHVCFIKKLLRSPCYNNVKTGKRS